MGTNDSDRDNRCGKKPPRYSPCRQERKIDNVPVVIFGGTLDLYLGEGIYHKCHTQPRAQKHWIVSSWYFEHRIQKQQILYPRHRPLHRGSCCREWLPKRTGFWTSVCNVRGRRIRTVQYICRLRECRLGMHKGEPCRLQLC